MRGFNKAIVMGNLSRDPELRYTVNKRAFIRFTVAVNYSWKDQNGEFKESADFVPVVAWGPLAENCSKYLRKGSGVFVEGRIQTGSYDAKDGSGKRYTFDVLASTIQFVGAKRSDEGASSTPSQKPDDSFRYGTQPAGKSVRERGFSDSDDSFPTDISEMDISEGGMDADIPF